VPEGGRLSRFFRSGFRERSLLESTLGEKGGFRKSQEKNWYSKNLLTPRRLKSAQRGGGGCRCSGKNGQIRARSDESSVNQKEKRPNGSIIFREPFCLPSREEFSGLMDDASGATGEPPPKEERKRVPRYVPGGGHVYFNMTGSLKAIR